MRFFCTLMVCAAVGCGGASNPGFQLNGFDAHVRGASFFTTTLAGQQTMLIQLKSFDDPCGAFEPGGSMFNLTLAGNIVPGTYLANATNDPQQTASLTVALSKLDSLCQGSAPQITVGLATFLKLKTITTSRVTGTFDIILNDGSGPKELIADFSADACPVGVNPLMGTCGTGMSPAPNDLSVLPSQCDVPQCFLDVMSACPLTTSCMEQTSGNGAMTVVSSCWDNGVKVSSTTDYSSGMVTTHLVGYQANGTMCFTADGSPAGAGATTTVYTATGGGATATVTTQGPAPFPATYTCGGNSYLVDPSQPSCTTNPVSPVCAILGTCTIP